MKHALLAFVLVCCSAASALEKLSLDGLWDFRLEEDRRLEELPALPSFEPSDRMMVPGCWDAFSRYYNQRGTGCYRREFTLTSDVTNAFLVVDQCGLRVKCWIDGRVVGFSPMPYNRLSFATGPLRAGRHAVVAAVDSVYKWENVPLMGDYYDFYAFGGFYHGVWLELQRQPVALRKVVVRTRDYMKGLVELEVLYAQNGPDDFSADVSFDGAPARSVAFKSRRARLSVPNFRLWSPESPSLHRVTLTTDHQQLTARFGIRTVGTANGRITLNGKPVYLKGVNRHEAHFEFGAAVPRQVMLEDVMNMKDLGCNFVRGSHYQQCEAFLDLCDEYGLMVWEESLGWGNGEFHARQEAFRAQQEEQTRNMVRESINHPSVVISGFLNEPRSDQAYMKPIIDRLIEVIRAEDSGHLVTFACHMTRGDICHEKTDIIAYNAYPGWYSHAMKTGKADELRAAIRDCHAGTVKIFREKYKDNRPIIVSETGVKAMYGLHDARGRAQFSEEFQSEYTRDTLEELRALDDIAGLAIWQFTDAKTYTRTGNNLQGREMGVNFGGLYDLYRRPKLAADEVKRAFAKEGK